MAASAALAATACGSTATASPTPGSVVSTGVAKLALLPQGTAALSRDRDTGLVSVRLDVYGMTPRSSHGVALRPGSCASPGGGRALLRFPDLVADTFGAVAGSLTARTSSSSIPTGGHLEIELGASAQAGSAPGSAVIACADINQTKPQAPLTLTAFPGQTPSGTVTLTYHGGGRLDVHVVATGLPASASHAVHIHFGSCRQQSGVLYTVGDIAADSGGAIDVTRTLTGLTLAPPPQGWYADIHLAPRSGLESGGQPTLFFQPLLCGDGKRAP